MTRRASSVPTRPTGTVTFLFTDIEGSSQRWERNRRAMQDAVHRHDRLVRVAIESNHGFVFKTVGDAFCGAFARAEDGIMAAVEAQRRLTVSDFSAIGGVRIRIALHTGTADERDGDYFGPAVNRVARLLDIAQPAQVLVSALTAELAREDLPEEIGLLDMGQHRLRDLAEREHIYQVLAPGLARDFPALAPLGSLPNNLPLQLTPLVGRVKERAEVRALLRKHRLVTLTGAGGIGKTRLAQQVGAEMLDRLGNGVWFVDLAPVADPKLVSEAIAHVLGLEESPSRPMLETLQAYLRNKRLLLVLDSCEHLLTGAADVVDALLRHCPEVIVLATSLEALGIAGEQSYSTPSLEFPSTSTSKLGASQAIGYASIALFVQRARAANPNFELTDENAPTVADICRRLDGIALAIELAAARVKTISLKLLDEKLDERFRLLRGGNRAAPRRHQALHALIDWSYELLSEEEKAFFRLLAVFSGGFTMDLATAICRADGRDLDVLDLLSSLVEKSLVQTETAGDNPRYRLLDSTRLYARQKLVEHGEFEAAAQAHCDAYLEVAQQLSTAFETMPDREWEILAEPELENWRTALEWSLGSRKNVATGHRLVAALGPFWASRAAVEGRRWIRLALATVAAETPRGVIARLELADANIAMYLTLWNAMLAAAERATALFEQTDDVIGATEARIVAGRALALLGRPEQGEQLLRDSLDVCATLRKPRLTGMALESLAMTRMNLGDITGSRPLYAKARAIFEEIGAEQAVANVVANQAGAEFRGGDAATAVALATEVLTRDHALNDPRIAVVMCNVAAYLITLGRFDEACEYARDGLRVARERHTEVQVVWAVQHLAAAAALRLDDDVKRVRDDRCRATQLLGFVEARFVAFDTPRKFTDQQEYSAMLSALREALAPDEFSSLMDEGATWSVEHAIAQALEI